MARTAVIAGTASATVGAVQGSQQRKAEAAAQQQAAQQATQQAALDSQQRVAELEQQMEAMQAKEATAAAMPLSPAATDMMTALNQLAQLKTQDLLSDEEFAAAKTKLLTI